MESRYGHELQWVVLMDRAHQCPPQWCDRHDRVIGLMQARSYTVHELSLDTMNGYQWLLPGHCHWAHTGTLFNQC